MSVLPVQSIVECLAFSQRIRFCITDPQDHIQEYHAAGRFYEEEQLLAFSRFLSPDRAFLDVGANIGNHTLFMSRVARASRVIPFEVNPDALAILRINLALNDCGNVDKSFLGIGLSSHEHRMSKAQTFTANLGGTRFSRDEAGSFTTIPADALVAHVPIGAVKIDVEGMEMDVLEGMKATIERWRPAVFIELEDSFGAEFEGWRQAFRYSVVQSFAPYGGKKEFLLVAE